MANFAKAELALEVREKDGFTIREHLTSAWRQSGVKPQELNVPTIPEDYRYLWEWFIQLHRSRDWQMGAPTGFKHREIAAWSSNYRIRLKPWELKVLMAMDTAYFKTLSKPKPEDQ